MLLECGEWLASVQTDKLAVRSSLLLLLLHRLAKADHTDQLLKRKTDKLKSKNGYAQKYR